MGKLNFYTADYQVIIPRNEAESNHLASNAAIVGEPLEIDYNAATAEFVVLGRGDAELGVITPDDPEALRIALENGYEGHVTLSLVAYDPDEKHFIGELVYQFFHASSILGDTDVPLQGFMARVPERIASGERPRVTMDTPGSTKPPVGSQPLPELPTGGAVMKRRKSLADKLVLAAYKNEPGCALVSGLVLLALLGGVIYLIVRFVF